MTAFVPLALHPVPEVGRKDTSLRYTDILFGFVIRELFLRLQNWPVLDGVVRWHLVAGTVLVLGSWIGYRRSLNRASYEVKFFNLPLWMFVVDQLMLVLYFRIAVLTDFPWRGTQDLSRLAVDATRLTMYVFLLYLIWDALAFWMTAATEQGDDGRRRPLYPAVDPETDKPTDQPYPRDWFGVGATAAGLAALVTLYLTATYLRPHWTLSSLIAVLLGYRWAKEIRTSWRLIAALEGSSADG